MSELLFLDSFDHYSTPQGARKWTNFNSSIVAGRTGFGARTPASLLPYKNLGVEQVSLTLGMAYKFDGLSFGTNAVAQFSNPLPFAHSITLHHVGDGRLRITAAPSKSSAVLMTNSILSAPSTFAMAAREWYYIEFRAAVATSGNDITWTYTVRVNEEEIMAGSLLGELTDQAKTIVAGYPLKYVNVAPGAQAIIDDLYVTKTEMLGDIQIIVLYPNTEGDATGWTPSYTEAGLPNWALVKERPADDDATYVAADEVDQKDLYHLDDIGLGFVGEIRGAQALWLAKKSDMGIGAIQGVWKSDDTESDSPTEFFPSALNYLYHRQAERVSLFTEEDWTKEEINAMQLGQKRTR